MKKRLLLQNIFEINKLFLLICGNLNVVDDIHVEWDRVMMILKIKCICIMGLKIIFINYDYENILNIFEIAVIV
jgi:hypothetical protein